jgi:RHS repeat-associated protein
MVTMQNERQASTSIYEPDSFVPMLRVDKQLQADERRAKGETRTYHVHCNHLGTPEALIAQDGLELVWQIELDPWGQTQREYNPNNMLQPIRMQGQQLDAETGLFYNRYRYYDPAGGRYVTQDPIGLLGGANLYGYVGGDPLFYVDPHGLQVAIPGMPPLPIWTPQQQEANRILSERLTRALNGIFTKNRTPEESAQAQTEYESYKKRCEQKPDDQLSECAKAIFNKKRHEDCARMRKEWDDKWEPGRHVNEIDKELKAVSNSMKKILHHCKPFI